MKRIFTAITAFLILLTLPMTALAETPVYSVTVSCYLNDIPVEDIELSLYKVGTIEDEMFSWDELYAGIETPDIRSVQSLQQAAQNAVSRIKGSGYAPILSQKTNKTGIANFQKLENGVYCIVGTACQRDNKVYDVIPVLVFVCEDLSIELKADVKDMGSAIDKTSVSVRKEWVLSDGKSTSPVMIGLMRDGVLIDTARLSESNNWSHTWSDLDANSIWSVKETVVPNGFVAELSGSDGLFVIVNRAVDTFSQTPNTGIGSVSYLPQMVVSAAVLAGAVMIFILLKKEQKQ